MEARLTVSVVIPCYNGSSYLRETLDSVIAQTYPVLEVIVIDDGSTDDSAAIAESYGAPVRVIRQPNQGESVARNRGIDEAKGDWIAFLDADDVWKPERLERQLEKCADDVVAAHCNLYLFGAEAGYSRIEAIPPEMRYRLSQLCCENSFGTPSGLIVRRSTCPRFPSDVRYGEDLVFLLELVQRGRVELCAEPLVGYRKHAGAQSVKALARLGWFETVEKWVGENPSLFTTEERERIRSYWAGRLAALAWKLKSGRQWKDYWEVRTVLSGLKDQREVQAVLKNRIYPRVCYRICDMIVEAPSTVRRFLSGTDK